MDSAEIIRTVRGRAGLTQMQLAERVGCAVQSVVNWETRRTSPSADKLIAVCNATGFELIIRGKHRSGDYSTTPDDPPFTTHRGGKTE